MKTQNVLNLIIPSDDEMREDLEGIDNLALMRLQTEKHIKLHGLWSATTIATKTIENLVKMVQEKCRKEGRTDSSINFNGIIECRLSSRRVEDAEKEGNLIVTFLIPESIEFIEHDESAQFMIPKDPKIRAELETLDNETRMELGSVNGLMLGHTWLGNTVTSVVLEVMIESVQQKLMSSGGNFTSINLNDALEIGARLDDPDECNCNSQIVISLRPGIGSRLAGKSDNITEYEE